MTTKFNIGDSVVIKGSIRRVEISRKEKILMFTKYNIGDSVLIKGTIRRIEITREGEIYYDVDTEGENVCQYGFSRVEEKDVEKWREERYDSMY